jgi:hypothetical protein
MLVEALDAQLRVAAARVRSPYSNCAVTAIDDLENVVASSPKHEDGRPSRLAAMWIMLCDRALGVELKRLYRRIAFQNAQHPHSRQYQLARGVEPRPSGAPSSPRPCDDHSIRFSDLLFERHVGKARCLNVGCDKQ